MTSGSFRASSLIVLLMTALLLGLTVRVAEPAHAINSSEYSMLRKLNNARNYYGIRSLRINSQISSVAREHSAQMAKRARIYHSNLEYTLRQFSWRIAGENVGRGPSLHGIYRAFMYSSSHRRNVLHRSFRNTGIGVVWRDGVAYVTVLFTG